MTGASPSPYRTPAAPATRRVVTFRAARLAGIAAATILTTLLTLGLLHEIERRSAVGAAIEGIVILAVLAAAFLGATQRGARVVVDQGHLRVEHLGMLSTRQVADVPVSSIVSVDVVTHHAGRQVSHRARLYLRDGNVVPILPAACDVTASEVERGVRDLEVALGLPRG